MKKLKKPEAVKNNPFMSKKWNELNKNRHFDPEQAQLVQLLCNWHAVLNQCMEDITFDGEMQVAYENKMGDIKAFPQIETMKKASHEIRQLNRQLGIYDGDEEVEDVRKEPTATEKVLKLVVHNRQARAAGENRS